VCRLESVLRHADWLGPYLFFGLPIGYRPFFGISIGYRPFYRITINDRNQDILDICSIFLLPGPATSCCVCGLCVCTGCTMCGVTEVKLKLFTVLKNLVAWLGVTSYLLWVGMFRSVDAVPWLRRLVAGR